jgi:hypothetical protein
MMLKTVAIVLLSVFLTAGVLAQDKSAKKTYLVKEFNKYAVKYGSKTTAKVKIMSGPEKIKMKRGKSPGQSWHVSLGDVKFRIAIEDKINEAKEILTIEEAAKRLAKVPSVYWRAFEIVSEKGKDGVAYYKSLGGAAAHGSQNYLNMVPNNWPAVVLHEVGHVMEQRARDHDPKILDKWEVAIKADNVSISRYGDKVRHEDLAEFAKLYGGCVDSGKGQLDKLKAASPKRFELWTKAIKLAQLEHKPKPKAKSKK